MFAGQEVADKDLRRLMEGGILTVRVRKLLQLQPRPLLKGSNVFRASMCVCRVRCAVLCTHLVCFLGSCFVTSSSSLVCFPVRAPLVPSCGSMSSGCNPETHVSFSQRSPFL